MATTDVKVTVDVKQFIEAALDDRPLKDGQFMVVRAPGTLLHPYPFERRKMGKHNGDTSYFMNALEKWADANGGPGVCAIATKDGILEVGSKEWNAAVARNTAKREAALKARATHFDRSQGNLDLIREILTEIVGAKAPGGKKAATATTEAPDGNES